MKKLYITTLLCAFAVQQLALSQTNAPDATPGTQPDVATNMPAAPAIGGDAAGTAPMTNSPASTAPGDQSTDAAVSSIPLIQFQDVPITTAIENLARQAGINYLLDPKIGYGQPDQNGQVKPEPQLSIRWQNITAENALLALLDNYGLQLIVDKKTGIYRVTMKDPSAPPLMITRV